MLIKPLQKGVVFLTIWLSSLIIDLYFILGEMMKKYISTILTCLLVFQLFGGAHVSPVYAANYDLAINKVVLTPSPYASGDVVSYRLTIANQGTVDFGSNITINDYLPEGVLF